MNHSSQGPRVNRDRDPQETNEHESQKTRYYELLNTLSPRPKLMSHKRPGTMSS